MLAYVTHDGAGAGDRLLAEVAGTLRSEGWHLAGAIQHNPSAPGAGRSHMDLEVLPGGAVIRISQDLGPGSKGCRLDPDGLERAAGLAASALASGSADLVVVNKFGKQEIEGRGFRPLIGQALAEDIPVLIAVGAAQQDAFLAFADGFATRLPAAPSAVLDWARSVRDRMQTA